MIDKVKCTRNIPGFTKGREYIIDDPSFDMNDIINTEYEVDLINDYGDLTVVTVPSDEFEVVK